MSLVYDGQKVELSGVETISFLDDPKVAPRITDKNPRTRRARAIVLHTTSGGCAKGLVLDVPVTSTKAEVYARYQTRTERQVSWDYTVDLDGTVLAQSDPKVEYSWHAGAWNPISVGIELVQTPKGELYKHQLDTLVLLVDWLTRTLKIQRQYAANDGKPTLVTIPRASFTGGGGADMVGVFAHCQNTTPDVRGPGDPGPAPFVWLARAGYEPFDYLASEDRRVWKQRQQTLGLSAPYDGIPLDDTVSALRAQKGRDLWVARPGD